MAKISVIGICGNSVFMNTDHFHQSGETITADSVYEELGGKGINQAVAAARMGAEVSFLAAAGSDDDYGRKCENFCKENHINAHIKIKKGKRSPLAFILTDKSGENRVTVHKDAELSESDVLHFEEEIKESDILLLQNEVPVSVNEAAVRLAKKHNVKVILNPAPQRDIPDTISDGVFLVTPNEQEAGCPDIKRFKNCITTLGERGCCINSKTIIPTIKQPVVDTTGAGDTFNGTLAVCIAEGMDMVTACRYATVASGLSVSKKHVMDSIPYRNETERMLKNE